MQNLRGGRIVTLAKAWSDYQQIRGDRLKPKTIADYEYLLDKYLRDWLHEPLTALTKERIEARHQLMTKLNGATIANIAMRFLSAIFNFAIYKYEIDGYPLIASNPVKWLTQLRAWNRETPRKRYLKNHELGPWLQAALSLKGAKRDVLLLLLFTGLRKSEGLLLQWRHVDLADRSIVIPNTKNGRDHALPMTDVVYWLLNERFESRRGDDDPYVFTGRARGSHISPTWPFPAIVKAKTGITFSLHDLRRTYISAGHALNLSPYTLKQLVNHTNARDMTERYICLSIEHLREPAQAIVDYLITKAGITKDCIMQD